MLCFSLNFTKTCQDWQCTIIFELTYKSTVHLSWGPRFCTWKLCFSFFGAWFMMICFAVQHRYYQSRTEFRRWSTSISRRSKSWYRTRSLARLHSCWGQVWNRGGPISEAVASSFFFFLSVCLCAVWSWPFAVINFKESDLNVIVSHGGLNFLA